jgi:hypothetical protein
MCKEFGIVTGPEDRDIPDSVYDMPELQNNPPDLARKLPKKRRLEDTVS